MGPRGQRQGRGPRQRHRERMHLLSGNIHWQVKIGFLFSRPFCYWSSTRKNVSMSLVDRWKSQFLDQEQDEYNISWRVERACVHGKSIRRVEMEDGYMERDHVKTKRSGCVTLGTRVPSISLPYQCYHKAARPDSRSPSIGFQKTARSLSRAPSCHVVSGICVSIL